MRPTSPLEAGARIADRYTVLRPIGRGGLATVWLVRHDALHTLHALKVLTVGSDALSHRLGVEGRTQAALNHPNVVPVTDLVRVGSAIGLVLQYVAGPSLRTVLASRERPLGLDEAHALFRGVAAGVAAAHRAGVVHRDLKPANVLLHVDEDRVVPRVTDFGLAKELAAGLGGAARDAHATRSGAMLGTPAYMAPEQVRDASRVDARADVFALGAVAYELVTGVRAFEGEDFVETLARIKAVRYTPVRELRPDAPEAMVAAIDGALVADPDGRFATVAALLEVWCRDGRPEPGPAFAAWVAAQQDVVEPADAAEWAEVPQDSGSSTWHESQAPAGGPAPALRPPHGSGPPAWALAAGGAALFAAGVALALSWERGIDPASPAPIPPSPPAPAVVVPPPAVAPPPPAAPEPAPPAAGPAPVASPAPAAPRPEVLPGFQSPEAAQVGLELGGLVADFTSASMTGREQLGWLRDELPARLDTIRTRATALADAHAGTDAELQAWYHLGHAVFQAHGFYRWARAPLNSAPEVQARWDAEIHDRFAPEAARTASEARAVFARIADPDHPAAKLSPLPPIARQMLAVLDRESSPR